MISLTFGCFHDHWGSFPVKTQLRRMKEKWKYKASHFTATAGKFKIEFQPWLLNTLIKPPSDFTEPGDFSVFFFSCWHRSAGKSAESLRRQMRTLCLSGPVERELAGRGLTCLPSRGIAEARRWPRTHNRKPRCPGRPRPPAWRLRAELVWLPCSRAPPHPSSANIRGADN